MLIIDIYVYMLIFKHVFPTSVYIRVPRWHTTDDTTHSNAYMYTSVSAAYMYIGVVSFVLYGNRVHMYGRMFVETYHNGRICVWICKKRIHMDIYVWTFNTTKTYSCVYDNWCICVVYVLYYTEALFIGQDNICLHVYYVLYCICKIGESMTINQSYWDHSEHQRLCIYNTCVWHI